MDDLMLPPLPEPELSDIALEKADANGICPVIDYYTADQMREYAKKAVEAEREACARVCDVLGNHLGMGREPDPDDCAASIRARR